MKKSIAAFVFLFAASIATPVLAQEGGWTQAGGLYVSGHGFVMNPRGTNYGAAGTDFWDYDLGVGGAGAIGYTFVFPEYGSDVRFEFEGSYRHAANDAIRWATGEYWDISDGNTTAASVMANLMIDFHTQTRLTPYIGAGIGRSRIALDSWTVDVFDSDGVYLGTFNLAEDEWYVTSWQVLAGVSYGISPGLTIDLEYRKFQPNDTSWNGLISNEFALGFRLTF